MGIKLDDKDECLGGTILKTSNRLYQLAAETQSGRTQEFGGSTYQLVGRGGKGFKPGERTKFARVIPAPIQLVNWDEVEGGKTPSKGKGLFDG